MDKYPTGSRSPGEAFPSITIDCVDPMAVELLTHVNDEHLVLSEDQLVPPVVALRMTVEGSSSSSGNFTFATRLSLNEENIDDPAGTESGDFIEQFLQDYQVEPTDESEQTYLLTTDTGYQYLFFFDESCTQFTLETAGRPEIDVPLARRQIQFLQHGIHSAKDALQDYLKVSKAMLTHLYLAYNQPNLHIPLAIRPLGLTEENGEDDPQNTHPRLEDLVISDMNMRKLTDHILILQHPEILLAYEAEPPRGIVLYGPAGVGTTSVALAVANQLRATLRVIRSSDIYEMYTGNSEKQVRAIFDEARQATTPHVVLLDRIDVTVKPQSNSVTHEAVYSLLEQEIGQISIQNPNVLVIATSRMEPDNISQSLFAPGRFDTHISIPLPDTEMRRDIFSLMLAKYGSGGQRRVLGNERIDCTELARASEGCCHAEIAGLIRKMVTAMAIAEMRTSMPAAPLTTEAILAALAVIKERRDKQG